jgi:MFS family permease
VVVLLTVTYIVSFIDRQILALLVGPIKHDLGLTDVQMGWLLGPAFAIMFAVLGLPFGWLTDRVNRRTLLAWGIALWCTMTAAAGLARSFWQLFVARLGVGVGEATVVPSALSLISDLFPRERLGRAIGFYSAGIGLGSGLAFLVGGQVIAALQRSSPDIQLFGEPLAIWQLTLIVVGLPGLLLVPLFALVREPRRRGRLGAEGQPSLAAARRWLVDHWQAYFGLFAGKAVLTTVAYSHAWIPVTFERTWGWGVGRTGATYGLTLMAAGLVGVNFGGWLGDRWYAAGRPDAMLRAMLAGIALLVPLHSVALLMPSGELVIPFMFLGLVGAAIATAAGSAALMMITPNEMRGQITSVSALVATGTGMMLGPTSVAYVTTYAFQDEAAIRWSLLLVVLVIGLVGLACLAAGRRRYLQAVADATD